MRRIPAEFWQIKQGTLEIVYGLIPNDLLSGRRKLPRYEVRHYDGSGFPPTLLAGIGVQKKEAGFFVKKRYHQPGEKPRAIELVPKLEEANSIAYARAVGFARRLAKHSFMTIYDNAKNQKANLERIAQGETQ